MNQLTEISEATNGSHQWKEDWRYDVKGSVKSTISTPTGQAGALKMRDVNSVNQLLRLGGSGKS